VQELGEVVLPAGTEAYLSAKEWSRVRTIPLLPWESVRVGPLEVFAVPAAHNGSRFHPLTSRHLAVGWVLRAGDRVLYYAGDTGFGDHLAAIAERFHPQLAILPIGAFRPRWPMRLYHLGPEDAVAAARVLGVDTVVPCHFGTFRLAWDGPAEALPRFASAAAAADLRWVMPVLWRENGKLAAFEREREGETTSVGRGARE